MGQFRALMYKNLKLQSKNACSSIIQLLVPVVCVLIVLSMQQLAKTLSEKNQKPMPVDLPFEVATILNFPLSGDYAKKYGGIRSCLKANKYGFEDKNDKASQTFVDHNLFFDNRKHLRNFICHKKDHYDTISPFFNKTETSSVEDMNSDVKDEMRIVYDSELAYREDHMTPSDGYYLFHEANINRINATIMSNNMNNQFYHRPNGQTQLNFGNIPVS